MLDGLCTAEVDKGYNKLFTDHAHLLELRGQLNKSSPSKSFLRSDSSAVVQHQNTAQLLLHHFLQ